MDSYHKRKHILEENYGKLITLKPFNYDIGKNTIASHRQQTNSETTTRYYR